MLGVSGDGIIPVKEGNDKLFRATLQRNFKFWNSIMVFLFTERTMWSGCYVISTSLHAVC